MGRKNRRLGNKELGPEVIKRILADNPSERHAAPSVSGRAAATSLGDGGFARMEADASTKESAADRQYHHARTACDRILEELDQELRSDHHV